jgi:hypothetical protein
VAPITGSKNPGAAPGGTGASFGNGNAVGTSNGFIQSSAGQAVASGTSGGNSTASTDLTVLSKNNAIGVPTNNIKFGGGLSGGTLNSAGTGGGQAGGTAMFGPSLALAIAAATPDVAAAVPETEVATVVVDKNSKNGGKNTPADAVTAAPAAPTAPAFNFDPAGLSTGGNGGGTGTGTGVTGGSISSPGNFAMGTTGNKQFFADEAYGTALANGFGFGVGSGVAVNNGGEQAGGSGGATGFGQGDIAFELDDIQNANFANSGTTTSNGGGGGYVGYNPNTPLVFGQSDPDATPSP